MGKIVQRFLRVFIMVLMIMSIPFFLSHQYQRQQFR